MTRRELIANAGKIGLGSLALLLFGREKSQNVLLMEDDYAIRKRVSRFDPLFGDLGNNIFRSPNRVLVSEICYSPI